MTRRVVPIVLFVSTATPARAFTIATSDQGNVPLHWEQTCVVYHVHEAGSADVPTDNAIDAVKKSFQTWTDVEGAYLELVFGGLTSVTDTGHDDNERNIVVWREDASSWEGIPSSVIGLTTVTYEVATGVIVDADIELNGVHFEFTTSATGVEVDIQNAVTHEVGHVVGLDHSTVAASTMVGQARLGELEKRDLHPDDVAGMQTLYPTSADPGVCDPSPVGDYYPKPRSASSGCAAAGAAGSVAAAMLLVVVAWLLRLRRVAPVALTLLLASPAQAYVLYMTSEGGEPLRWFTPDVTIVFDDGVPEEVEREISYIQIEDSFRAWGDLACSGKPTPFGFRFDGLVTGRKVGFDEGDDATNENLVVWVHDGWGHGSSVLALTSLTYSTTTGEIVDGDLELNDQMFTYAADALEDEVDLRNTVVHETGHFLGLDHSLSGTATMYDKAPLGETTKRSLELDDVSGFCALYGPDAPPKLVSGGLKSSGGGAGSAFCAAGPIADRSPLVVVAVAFALLAGVRRASRARSRCR